MTEKKIKVTCTFGSQGDAKKAVQHSFQIYLKQRLSTLSENHKDRKPVCTDAAD